MSVINSVLKEIDDRPALFRPIDLETDKSKEKEAGGSRAFLVSTIVLLVLLLVFLLVYLFGLSEQGREVPSVTGSQPASEIETETISKPAAPDAADLSTAVQPQANETTQIPAATVGSQVVVKRSVTYLTGLQISESADALELWFHFDSDFRHSLKRRSGNRYQFQISDAVSQIDVPRFDGQWLSAFDIRLDEEHLLLDLVTENQVLVSTYDIEQGNDYFWVVRLERMKEVLVSQVNSAPVVEPTDNVTKQNEPENSPEKLGVSQPEVKLAIKPAIQPESNQLRLENAVVDLQAGRWRQAMTQFQRLLSSDVDKQARLNLLALYQSRQMAGEFDGLLQSSLARYSNDSEFQVIYANRLFQKGLYQELVDRYSANRGSPQVTSLTAAAYQRLGNHPLAVSAYQRALQADATQGKNWISLAISLEKLGQSNKALDAYQTALKSNGINSRLRQFVSGRIQALAAGN